MNKIMAIWTITSISVLTGLIAFWRAIPLLAWYPIPVKGTAGKIVIALLFTLAAAVFGFVAMSVYIWLVGIRPETALQIYLWLGVGLAILISIFAVVMGLVLKRGPVIAWILFNFLWGVGYGWVMPLLMRR